MSFCMLFVFSFPMFVLIKIGISRGRTSGSFWCKFPVWTKLLPCCFWGSQGKLSEGKEIYHSITLSISNSESCLKYILQVWCCIHKHLIYLVIQNVSPKVNLIMKNRCITVNIPSADFVFDFRWLAQLSAEFLSCVNFLCQDPGLQDIQLKDYNNISGTFK